jgi:hypothetical protein
MPDQKPPTPINHPLSPFSLNPIRDPPLPLSTRLIPRLPLLHIIQYLRMIQDCIPVNVSVWIFSLSKQSDLSPCPQRQKGKERGTYGRSCAGCTVELYSSSCFLIASAIPCVLVGFEIALTAATAPTAPRRRSAVFFAAALILRCVIGWFDLIL